MQLNSYLDVDVVAVEQDDQITTMLELIAPVPRADNPRPPAAVQVVLDRSGSMSGDRLDAAKLALIRLVDRLEPSDQFGLVVFDDEVQVVIPAGPVADKQVTNHAIAQILPGGCTNLSAGLLRGLQEARRVAGQTGATLLLLSDGHANSGEVDPARLGAIAESARQATITTSTIGIGLGYDEVLLSALARGGQGNHVFAEQVDDAAAAVAGEVEGLLSKTVQAASLIIRSEAAVDTVTIWNDLPSSPIDGGIMVELGDLWAGETRKLVISFAVPAKPGLGLARVADLELRYVALPEFAEQTITMPVHVNVVPGDHAAGRIPNPKVRTELIYQKAQDAKRKASDALRSGDYQVAEATYESAVCELRDLMCASPSQEIAEELDVIDELRVRSTAGEVEWAGKFSAMDHARKSRQRGRNDH